MLIRHVRRLAREPYWIGLVGAVVLGAVIGPMMARMVTDDETSMSLFGKAWRGTPAETRAGLGTLFGITLTLLTLVVSLSSPMVQSAANQYSPRLVPFYLRKVPLRRVLPVFAFAGAYLATAIRELGLLPDEAVRPRAVFSWAVTIVVAAFALLVISMILTFRFLRVERILGLVRDSTIASVDRVAARLARLPLAPGARLDLRPDASPLRARAAGYLVEVDVRKLTRLARRAAVRARICRTVGDYLDRGEVVGWVVADAAGAADEPIVRRLAAALAIAPARLSELDPAYGIRILADVAARALPSAVNDPYTARQALQHIRSILCRLARAPLGDWNVVDGDGSVRVSVMSPQLRELISVAVEAPLRYGAGDPEVLDGVLEIALEVGLAAHDAEGRAAAYRLITRTLDHAMEYGKLDSVRLKRLLAEVEMVRASLGRDLPRPDRHARADWVLLPDVADADADAEADAAEGDQAPA